MRRFHPKLRSRKANTQTTRRKKRRFRRDTFSREALFPALDVRCLEQRRVLSVVVDAGVDQTNIDEGSTISLDPATFDDSAAPHTAEINWGDGFIESGAVEEMFDTISGSHTYADNGVYTVTITVTDDRGEQGSDSFDVSVNNVAPLLTAAQDQTIDEGSLLSITDIGLFTDPGFDNPLNTGGELEETFTYVIDWGDGTGVNFGVPTIDTAGSEGVSTAGSFDGSHTYADNGIYTVTVTVSDDDGGVAQQTFNVTVNNVAPNLTVSPDQIVDEGSLLSITDIGTFTDPGFDNPLNTGGELEETFTYVIDWGDGTSVNFGVPTIDTPGSEGVSTAGSFDGSHTYADNGIYTVTVTVSDDDGGIAQQTFNVTVNNVAPNLTVSPDQIVDEGSLLSIIDIGTFTDPGFDNPLNPGGPSTENFTYTINWGDGTTIDAGFPAIDTPGSEGVSTAGSFDGSHTYADNGIYTVTVTVIDDDGGIGQETFSVTVNNVAPTLGVPGDQMVDEGVLLSLPNIGIFTDPGFDNLLNPVGETMETFTYTVDWGDGTSNDFGAATIDNPGSEGVLTTGSFDGSHTFNNPGVYTVTVTVADDDLGVTSATFQVTVKNVPPILITAEDQLIDEGSLLDVTDIGVFTALDPVDPLFTYTIDWGDGLPGDGGNATIDSFGGPGEPLSGSFDGSHIYADNGIYTVTLTVHDSDGGSVSETLLVTVNNVAPTLSVPVNQSVTQAVLFTIEDIGVFTDPGFDNPLNLGGETSETFVYTVDWGDGTVTDFGVPTVDAPGSPGVLTGGSFDGTHSYNGSGLATVTVTVVDDDGGVDTLTFQIIVLPNDPPPVPGLPFHGGVAAFDTPQDTIAPLAPQPIQGESESSTFETRRTASTPSAEKRYVLRVVSPTGEESEDVPLKDEVLDELSDLYLRLPDDHYRIYLIRVDGTERLVLDFHLRDGKPVDPADPSEELRDRPPSHSETNEGEKAPLDQRASTRLSDPNSRSDSILVAAGSVEQVAQGDLGEFVEFGMSDELDEEETNQADPANEFLPQTRPLHNEPVDVDNDRFRRRIQNGAAALAGAGLIYSSNKNWRRRVEDAMRQTPGRRFSKAARLARRVME